MIGCENYLILNLDKIRVRINISSVISNTIILCDLFYKDDIMHFVANS